MLLTQISDTHFGTERAEVMQALERSLAACPPDALLLCGDITQRARRSQFEAAARFTRRLPARKQIAIPGNHDIPLFNLWARVFSPYANYAAAFGARTSLWSEAGVTVLALDATHPARHKNGALPAEYLRERLGEARRAAGAEGLLVVVAHQPLWTAWEMDHAQTLIGREEAARIMAEHRVDAVLSGHVHVPLIALSSGPFAQLPWTFVLSGSGTAVSHRTRPGAPNSFNTLELEPGTPAVMTIERYDYQTLGFACVERQRFVRSAQGWGAA